VSHCGQMSPEICLLPTPGPIGMEKPQNSHMDLGIKELRPQEPFAEWSSGEQQALERQAWFD
jgi:hypothetical protein